MQFIICSKHNKSQKAAHKVTTNSYVCMNRYCQQSFLTLCNVCKNDHRDHSNKILTLQDITFLIERLLKSPFKELTIYIDEAVNAMKKFKLIQENKRKIQILQKEIYKEVIGLVEFTQSLIHEYAVCKKKITQLSDMLVNVQTPSVFAQFTKNSTTFLSNLQYNFQKDKFQYGNQIIREKYENRRKAYEKTKRRLQEVKDYSMKIIQVILANEDSDQEEQDIIYKKKMYEILKRELQESHNKNTQLEETLKRSQSNNRLIKTSQSSEKQYSTAADTTKLSREKSETSSNSNNTMQASQNSNFSGISEAKKVKSIIPANLPAKVSPILSIEKSCQTSSQWLKAIEQSNRESEMKIKRMQQSHAKALNQLQNKIATLVKEKQAIKKEYSLLEQKQKVKNDKILQIEAKLRQNKKKRENKERQKETKFQKLIDMANWKTIVEGDRID